MEQKCGNCAFCDLNDSRTRDTFFEGTITEYRCLDGRGYKKVNEGKNCVSYRELPQQGSSGCFITTLLVQKCHFDDKNGRMISTLRSFRDDVLSKMKDKEDILKTYDIIGPKIKDRLQEEDITFCYKLYSEKLIPVATAIEDEEYDTAVDKYKSLVDFLQTKYGIKEDISTYEYDENSVKGHGRARVHKINVK